LAAVWKGRGGMWKKKKEKQRKRGRESVGKSSIYWRLPIEYSIGKSVFDFAGGSDTSLLGCPGLNPSIFSSIN